MAKEKRMSSPALKAQLEDLLKAHRLQREAPPLRGERRLAPLPTGLSSLDELLDGGWPRGQVSEAWGAASSGRTGLALAAAAALTGQGALAAWVDPADRWSPASAAEAGADLARLLWLRGPRPGGLPRALAATDVLLGSGLFDLVVLDLAGFPRSDLARLPHTTWHRLQRTVAPLPVVLLILADAHLAHGPGGVSLALSPAEGCWVGQGPGRLLTGLSTQAHWSRRVQGRRLHLPAFA